MQVAGFLSNCRSIIIPKREKKSAVAPLPAVFWCYSNSYSPQGILAIIDPVFSDIICDLFHIKKITDVYLYIQLTHV